MKSLRMKLVLITCLISMICLVITAAISYRISSSRMEKESTDNYQYLSEICSNEIEGWLNEQVQVAVNQKAVLEIQDFDREALCHYLEMIINEYNEDGYIYDIYFTSVDNVMSAGSGYIQDPEIDFTKRDWFIGALETDGIYYSNPYLDADSGKIVITIATQIKKDKETTGVLAIDIFVDTLVDIVNTKEVPEDSYIFILDGQNGIVNHPNEAYGYVEDVPVTLEQLEGMPYLALENAITEKEESVVEKDYDGVLRTFFPQKIDLCGWNVVVAVKSDIIDSAANSLLGGFVVALLISLVICVVITMFSSGQFLKPIKLLTKKIESGDFSKSVEIYSNDEIGKLAAGFNRMLDNLQDLLRISQSAVSGIKDSADNLNVASEDIISASNTVHLEMNNIAGDMEVQYREVENGKTRLLEFDNSIEHFNCLFENMADVIKDNIKNLEESSVTARQLENSTNQTTEMMNEIYGEVKDLEVISGKITDMVSTITNISSQTNLLALNASIEAARAGDAGKGFVVVADEVRVLSEQTAEATKNIVGLVADIRAKIDKTVGTIHASSQMFEMNAEHSKEVIQVFDELKDSIEKLGNVNVELSDSVEEFVDSKKAIVQAFENISEHVNACVSSSNDAKEAAKKQDSVVELLGGRAAELNILSENLKQSTDKLMVKDNFTL